MKRRRLSPPLAEDSNNGLLHKATERERGRMSNTDDAMADWGIEFVHQVDTKLQEPGYEETLEFWGDGDFDAAYSVLKELYPEVTEDQWSWVEEFLSEI